MIGVIIEQSIKIVSALLLMLIGVLGTWLTAKIAKRQELTNISMAMNELIAMTQQTVGELEQALVRDMKEAAEDGKLSEQDIISLGMSLYNITIKKLSDPAKKLLEAAGVDIHALITSAGEDWINSIRTAEGIADVRSVSRVDAIGFDMGNCDDES